MSGRSWAYTGAGLGGAVSIAANVAHSYVPPEGAAPGWTPHAGSVVGAVFWPMALFVAVEIMARVPWPDGRRWVLLRFGGLVPVAAVAAFVSYRHLSGLLAFYGEDRLTAVLGPLAVDGLMVMATGALIATGARRAPAAEPVREPAGQADRPSGQVPERTDHGQVERTGGQVPGQVPGGQVNGHVLTILPAAERTDDADRVPVLSSVASGQAAANGNGRAGSGAYVVGDHAETLAAELKAKGKLSRYRVEQVCGVGGRRATAIRRAVYERAGVPLPDDGA